MIDIRLASRKDIEVLALLGRITYTESHGHFIADKKDLLAYNNKTFSKEKITLDFDNKNNLYHIIYVDNLPVGYSKIILNTPFEGKNDKTSCRLERIYILSDFIPQKLGYKFLQFIEQTAKKHNATSLWLSVYIKNEKAINFYKRNDFTNIGELNFLVNGKAYDNLVLSKEI